MVFIKLALVFAAAIMFLLACVTRSEDSASRANRANINRPAVAPSIAPSPKAIATPPSSGALPELASARALYKQNCAACHGANGQGNVAWKVPSLKDGVAATHSEEELARQIAAGGKGMPPYKDSLSSEQRASLVRLIRQEFQGKGKTN